MGELVKLNRPTNLYDNIGGIKDKVFIAPKDWFTAIQGWKAAPTPPALPAAGDMVTIDQDHTFSTGKGFITLEFDFKTSNIEGEKSADFGSNNKKFTIIGHYYGITEEAAEVEALLNNNEVICIVEKLDGSLTTKKLQFGLKDMPGRVIDAKWKTGTPDSGYAGCEFTIECFQPRLAFYKGVITEKP